MLSTSSCGSSGSATTGEAIPSGESLGGASGIGASGAGGASAGMAGSTSEGGNATATGGSSGGSTQVATSFVSVCAGGAHICAVLDTGRVRCWGFGGRGQLGDGNATGFTQTPVDVTSLTGATLVACGGEDTCALAGGDVHCWGHDDYGQIGDGKSGDSAASFVPSRVTLPEPATAITAGGLHFGGGHNCALGESGSVYCWGSDSGGQIGDGKSAFGLVVGSPFRIDALPGKAVRIAAGGQHTCAIVESGAVLCWGYDYAAQTGDGKSGDGRMTLVPTEVPGLPGRAKELASGDAQSCAILENGDVWCWGEAGFGAFGIASPMEYVGAIASFAGSPARAIDVGALHGCVVRAGGDVDCAGMDDLGEVGSGMPGPFMIHTSPVHVDVHDAISITAGSSTTCALRAGGRLSCWGDWMGSAPTEVIP